MEPGLAIPNEHLGDRARQTGYITANVGRWDSVYSVFGWINCGHPPPLLLCADDTLEELATAPDLPLGAFERARPFRRHQRRLGQCDRLVLYFDGVSRRRAADGLFGTQNIVTPGAGDRRALGDRHGANIREAVASGLRGPAARLRRRDCPGREPGGRTHGRSAVTATIRRSGAAGGGLR